MASKALSKGKKNELLVKKELERLGYITEKTIHNRFHKDFFNLFDIIAVGNNEVKFVQVKTNKKLYKSQLEPFKHFKKIVGVADFVEIWIVHDKDRGSKYYDVTVQEIFENSVIVSSRKIEITK